MESHIEDKWVRYGTYATSVEEFNYNLQTDESDTIIHCNNNNIDTRRVWFDIIEIIVEDLLVLWAPCRFA